MTYFKDSSDGVFGSCCRTSEFWPNTDKVETEDERCLEADETPDDVDDPPPENLWLKTLLNKILPKTLFKKSHYK